MNHDANHRASHKALLSEPSFAPSRLAIAVAVRCCRGRLCSSIPRVPFSQLLSAAVCAVLLVACSRKLTKEDCNHLLGRGVGLAAYQAASAEVPVDIEALKKRARGASREQVDTFDRACVGALDAEQVACARRARNNDEFRACGGLVRQAREAGEVLQLTIAKQYSPAECGLYGEHAVKIGASRVDDVGEVVQFCDLPMEIGVYRCKMAATNAVAWKACE